jgi:hypothetical protein
MAEPLFFDCLTDAQFWSLFDSGVLQAYMVPRQAFQRLESVARAHACYLFAWPAERPPPALHDIVPSLGGYRQESLHEANSETPRMPICTAHLRAEIETFCARVHAELPTEGGRIHAIRLNRDIELYAGPYLEPVARDLAAMSLPELEAYLDAMLRLDHAYETDVVAPGTHRPPAQAHDHTSP